MKDLFKKMKDLDLIPEMEFLKDVAINPDKVRSDIKYMGIECLENGKYSKHYKHLDDEACRKLIFNIKLKNYKKEIKIEIKQSFNNRCFSEISKIIKINKIKINHLLDYDCIHGIFFRRLIDDLYMNNSRLFLSEINFKKLNISKKINIKNIKDSNLIFKKLVNRYKNINEVNEELLQEFLKVLNLDIDKEKFKRIFKEECDKEKINYDSLDNMYAHIIYY